MSKKISLDRLRNISRKHPIQGAQLIQAENAEDCRTMATMEWPVASATHW
jgi:hypothetical protein